MKCAVCSGSFDPVTNGHLDIFTRAARLTDELVVCVFNNRAKRTMFSLAERVALLQTATSGIGNIKIDSFDGLLADYLKAHNIKTIVRGIRSSSDFAYETQSALINKHIYDEAETIFLLSAPELSYVSSTAVKELAYFGADIDKLVPECVKQAIGLKLKLSVKNS